MQVRIVRDERVAPGGEGTILMPGELLFVMSAAGVTQEGADALEDAWSWFIDRGLWRFGEPGGVEMSTTYRLAELPGRVAARVDCWPGEVECLLSPQHFTKGSVNGLQITVRRAVGGGWRYYPAEVPAVRAS